MSYRQEIMEELDALKREAGHKLLPLIPPVVQRLRRHKGAGAVSETN